MEVSHDAERSADADGQLQQPRQVFVDDRAQATIDALPRRIVRGLDLDATVEPDQGDRFDMDLPSVNPQLHVAVGGQLAGRMDEAETARRGGHPGVIRLERVPLEVRLDVGDDLGAEDFDRQHLRNRSERGSRRLSRGR